MNTKKKITITLSDGRQVEAAAPVIVSASRATDIPAFYAEWFFGRLKAGYCSWRNPFSGVDSYVSFAKTRFIVFWSKNPDPIIPYLTVLKDLGIGCYVQYTLNDYEIERFEPDVPPLSKRIDTFRRLVEILGFGHVVWRFDPLLLTDNIGIPELLTKIENIVTQLRGYTEKMVFSFADISGYQKVKKNLDKSEVRYIEWDEYMMEKFASQLSKMNHEKGWNLQLATCGERIDLSRYGIIHNRCVDDELITRLAWHDCELMTHLGIKIHKYAPSIFGIQDLPEGAIHISDSMYAIRSRSNKAFGQRVHCGCTESKDIGRYDTCPHGCFYCYANTSPMNAQRNHQNHKPLSETI